MRNSKPAHKEKSSDDIAIEATASAMNEEAITEFILNIEEQLDMYDDMLKLIEPYRHPYSRSTVHQELSHRLYNIKHNKSRSFDERFDDIIAVEQEIKKCLAEVRTVQSPSEPITVQPATPIATLPNRANKRSLHTQKTDEKACLLDSHAETFRSEAEKLRDQERRHYNFWTCFGLCDCDEESIPSLQHN